MASVLEVKDLTKSYPSNQGFLTVLHAVSFKLNEGDTVAIVGPSGSGKTTLLGLCAGLDKQTSGSVILCDISLDNLNEDQRAKTRNQFVGFVFQNFQLIPTLTALENVMVPVELRGTKSRQVRDEAANLLERVGLGDRLSHYPAQLSGGEQQRVALARSFINHPKILFADEPTGNLDTETGEKIEALLFDLNKTEKTTLVLVTHNSELAEKTERIIKLKGGIAISDSFTQKKNG